jgi:type VI secretion system secreted protein VgrG
MLTADSFGVLGASTVTNVPAAGTVITGNLGVWSGLAVTGFPPGIVTGTIHAGDAVAQTAQDDVTTAYNALAGLAPHGNVGSGILTGTDLGGLTLTSGVYHFATSAQLTGTLTLDAQGLDNAYWVFQIGSTLTTAPDSVVHSLVQVMNLGPNGGVDYGVFWQVGSSATLGTYTDFEGNILALADITVNTGATILNGRALARTGAVTLDNNLISTVCPIGEPGNGGPGFSRGLTFDSGGNVVPYGGPPLPVVPEPLSMLLFLSTGLIGIAAGRRRARAR